MESSSSKRAKAPGIISQAAHCLVDGCNADLNLCRDYHRRHKVCQVHSKTAVVTIAGREQRFCQQCSRFHSLVEFDEGKRSCRKRLDGHNRRRRKPQPDSVPRSPLAMSGPRLLSFNNPQALPSTAVSSSWSNIIKQENETTTYDQQHHMNNFNERPFTSHIQLGNNLVDSDHALSLLSSGPTTREPTVNDYTSGCLGRYSFGQERVKTVVPGADSHGSRSSNVWSTLNFPGMFQHQGEGSSASGSHQTLTFMWD